MRRMLVVLVGVVWMCGAFAQAPEKRYDVEPDLAAYPQASPQEALASAVKAIEYKRIDYLLAQLADPQFVDHRVKEMGGKFADLVQETTTRLVDDPTAVKRLQQLLKEGDWDVKEGTASVHLKDAKDHWVFLRKEGGRWFMENRHKPTPEMK